MKLPDCCVTYILAACVQVPEPAIEIVSDVEPPPDDPLIRLAREFLIRQQQHMSLSERLQQFADKARSMPAALRQRSLTALDAAVRADRYSLLWTPGPSTPRQASSPRRLCVPEAEQAAWKLAWLAGELIDDELAAFAGAA